MVSVSSFEGVFCESDVCFRSVVVVTFDGCLVDNCNINCNIKIKRDIGYHLNVVFNFNILVKQRETVRKTSVYYICIPQTADCRPQIADCKLKDTKNLPNKGDTIKNITSCESEKVAWEQG